MRRRELLRALSGLPLLGGAAPLACKSSALDMPGVVPDGVALPELDARAREQLATYVLARVRGETPEPDTLPLVLRETPCVAYVGVREAGRLVAEAWGYEGAGSYSLRSGIDLAREQLGDATFDAIELDLAHDYRTLEVAAAEALWRLLARDAEGIVGVETRFLDKIDRNAPTQLLARNHSARQEVERLWRQFSITAQEFFDGQGVVRRFAAAQFVIAAGEGTITPLLRGNIVVEPGEVGPALARASADLMIAWLLAHLHDEGRTTYTWLPATSRAAKGNNVIRQWTGTLALIEVARRRADAGLWARVDRNVEYNLAAFYVEREGVGLILEDEQAKLGALALAALALAEHPARDRWASARAGLQRALATLRQPSGKLESYFGRSTPDDDETQAFYPGEALLAAAAEYALAPTPAALADYTTSFRHYRARFEATHQAAAVPWQSLAHARMAATLRASGAEPQLAAELEDFVLAMNDWLVETLADWAEALPDERGQFRDRKQPAAATHSAATASYMEGLIAAWRIARARGDQVRTALYQRTLARALRNVAQLQFVDAIDMYYVVERERTRGGLRASPTRSEVRIDAVAHALLAVLAMLDEFEPDDYACE
jgi:hypothetical protein